MQFKYIFVLCILVITTSCIRNSREAVLRIAQRDMHVLSMRYEPFLTTNSDEEIIEYARLLAYDSQLSFSHYMWHSFVGNDHLTHSRSAPLHKAIYVMRSDSETLSYYLYNLERHCLFDTDLYKNMHRLQLEISSCMRIIEKHVSYTEEVQYIEQKNIQKSQLYEQQKQTRLLESIAEDTAEAHRRPDITHVKSYNVYL